jgi:hypothetical protein
MFERGEVAGRGDALALRERLEAAEAVCRAAGEQDGDLRIAGLLEAWRTLVEGE